MKIMTVIGSRPEIIQTAPVSKAFRRRGHHEILVHTGQHYDRNMSDVFFADLDVPEPDLNLGVGSGSHAEQTGQMMIRLEATMLDEKPDWVVVFGDTNSTVAASLAAAKLLLPLAHIEAGLRSFDRTMPEEINRIVTDHISTILFAPTQAAVENLRHEGIVDGVHQVGDVRVDLLLGLRDRAAQRSDDLLNSVSIEPGAPFALATIHRAANTDDPQRLGGIVSAFSSLDMPVILPVHPRLRKMLDAFDLQFGPNVRTVEPLGFLDMVTLLETCAVVITDSGGLQKEAYMLNRPIVTVRDSTEWVETVESGWNRLCEPEVDALKAAAASALHERPAEHPDFYGAYNVCERLCAVLESKDTIRAES